MIVLPRIEIDADRHRALLDERLAFGALPRTKAQHGRAARDRAIAVEALAQRGNQLGALLLQIMDAPELRPLVLEILGTAGIRPADSHALMAPADRPRCRTERKDLHRLAFSNGSRLRL